jgi:hypothetical protein
MSSPFPVSACDVSVVITEANADVRINAKRRSDAAKLFLMCFKQKTIHHKAHP